MIKPKIADIVLWTCKNPNNGYYRLGDQVFGIVVKIFVSKYSDEVVCYEVKWADEKKHKIYRINESESIKFI